MSTPGASSSISSPTVPCPAITSGSSNGCTRTRPVSARCSSSRRTRSAGSSASSVDRGAERARSVELELAPARPGEDDAVEPLRGRAPGERHRVVPGGRARHAAARSSALSAERRFTTPRALNEPVCWKSSAFSTSPGARSDPSRSGVRRTRPRIVSAARTTSSRVTGWPLGDHRSRGDPRASPRQNARVNAPLPDVTPGPRSSCATTSAAGGSRCSSGSCSRCPHLVWASLYGTAAFTLAFVVWLAVLVERRAPGSLHRFLANYTRYTVHLTAYLCLAADPYPGFTGAKPYPVDVEIDPPATQRRLSAGFRFLLAIPAFLLASALAGSMALGAASAPRCSPGSAAWDRPSPCSAGSRASPADACREACATPLCTQSGTARRPLRTRCS